MTARKNPAIALTDAYVLKAPLDSTTLDTKSKLQLVVSPLGKRTWSYYAKVPGSKVPLRVKLGNADGPGALSSKQARTLADQRNVEIRKPEARVEKPNAIPTFQAMVTAYGMDWVQREFDQYMPDWLGLRMDKLTAEMVEAQEKVIQRDGGRESRRRNERAGKPVADNAGFNSVTKAAKALRAIFNYAKEREKFMGKNLGLKMTVTEGEPRRVWLDDEQYARLLEVLDNPGKHGLQPWTRNYYRLLLATGSRRTALLKARWTSIDFQNKVMTVPARDAKNGETNFVQLGKTAIKFLEEQREAAGDSPFVFPSPQRDPMLHHMTFSWVEWEKVRDAAGLKGFTPHDLRRTFASQLVSRGAPIKVVSVAINHKNVATTERVYGHIAPKAIHDALELLE